MIKEIKQVEEFHDAYRVGNGMNITETAVLRTRLINEEAKEVEQELAQDYIQIDKLAKELADLLYVTYGTIVTYGLQEVMPRIFDEVHRSNMSKLEDGKPLYREDGKVLKGKNYTPADVKSIINDTKNKQKTKREGQKQES